MPYKHWGCGICDTQAPVALRKHGMFEKRMKWLREHYKEFHQMKRTKKLHSWGD